MSANIKTLSDLPASNAATHASSPLSDSPTPVHPAPSVSRIIDSSVNLLSQSQSQSHTTVTSMPGPQQRPIPKCLRASKQRKTTSKGGPATTQRHTAGMRILGTRAVLISVSAPHLKAFQPTKQLPTGSVVILARITSSLPHRWLTRIYAQPEGAHITRNYYGGIAQDNAGAHGGNANFGDQSGARITIGSPPQITPTDQAHSNTVNDISEPTSYVLYCTIG